MISPEEIKQQAQKWWKPFLQSCIVGQPFFPKSIERIGKVQAGHITQRFEALQQEIEALYRHSKNQTGTGYRVKTASRNFRRTGNHELPDAVLFETAEDYVAFIGRKKEWKLFLRHFEQLVTAIPALKDWAPDHCLWLTQAAVDWESILKVCQYFIETPRPHLYIRQLPIQVHTKFIEENPALLQSLLNFLIPNHIRSPDQKRFAERYFLKYDEPLIRIRMLDPNCPLAGKLTDISIPLSDFEHTPWPADRVLITENKMNFLTLPPMPATIAVWSGGGFQISYLRDAAWLKSKNIYYWGDIDEHGFKILHQLRSYYASARSILMDRQTYELFRTFAVDGPRNKAENLSLLHEDEKQLYQYLKSLNEKNRLEQEKLPQAYVNQVLEKHVATLTNQHTGL